MPTHSVDNCKSVFVSWKFLVPSMISLAVVLSGATWKVATIEAGQNEAINETRRDVQDMKRIMSVIEGRVIEDLDYIKTELRRR